MISKVADGATRFADSAVFRRKLTFSAKNERVLIIGNWIGYKKMEFTKYDVEMKKIREEMALTQREFAILSEEVIEDDPLHWRVIQRIESDGYKPTTQQWHNIKRVYSCRIDERKKVIQTRKDVVEAFDDFLFQKELWYSGILDRDDIIKEVRKHITAKPLKRKEPYI